MVIARIHCQQLFFYIIVSFIAFSTGTLGTLQLRWQFLCLWQLFMADITIVVAAVL
jgi:hypothetical protein